MNIRQMGLLEDKCWEKVKRDEEITLERCFPCLIHGTCECEAMHRKDLLREEQGV